MRSVEARYALRYALILLVEALADAITLILEADYDMTPESYREAMLLAGEASLSPQHACPPLPACRRCEALQGNA